MAYIPRNKKRDSARSGFTYKEIRLVDDNGFLVGPDEFDAPPPSTKSLGGEGDISGDPRPNSTTYTTPSAVDRQTRYVTASGISASEDINIDDGNPVSAGWLYIAGSNQNITITANPQISRGRQNQILTLQCVGSSVLLSNGNGLNLRTHFNMDSGAIINFMYSVTNNLWNETSRSHMTKNLGAF
jgi:hypothetical protein